jgi:thiamine biosynthesis lipoprotein
LLALLSECQRFSELSGGSFDDTVQPLWNVYAAHFFGSEPLGIPTGKWTLPRAVGISK